VREELRRQYLEAMGIQAWVQRGPAGEEPVVPEVEAQPVSPTPDIAVVAVASHASDRHSPATQQERCSPETLGDVASLGWEGLQARVAGCTACPLHATRTQTVFGVGNREAELMVIGEAPGADEDLQGEPFVGRAGQLLNAMLQAIGLQREAVYIANILKCRPPGNRDPLPEEVAHCEPFLQRQIELVRPRVILAVGRVAAQNLLHTAETVGKLRGHTHRLGEAGIPVIVTYHPAYLLRSPDQKGKAWQDLLTVIAILKGAGN
jgi:uracil-DNA glycosylase family 4